MERVKINNKGIPPLAGLCSYEEACRIGYSVDHNVNLLLRYNFVETQLNQVMAAHLAHLPEWEVKGALGLHMWLDAEHSAWLRKRVTEMREPPHHLDKVPDERLRAFIDELIRSESTLELLVGIYQVAKPELIRSLKKHLDETNPLTDHPTCRMLRLILMEEESMIPWGEAAINALLVNDEAKAMAENWKSHLQAFLRNAGGIPGETVGSDEPANSGSADSPVSQLQADLKPRSDGQKYEMNAVPRRDDRFLDTYNSSADFDAIYFDEERPADERTYALLFKRLREMDVPEWMAPIIYKTEGKPWEYYQDLSRQLWDEVRHSMLGEIGLYQDGVEFYKYPVEFLTSLALNTTSAPLEAHLVLWYIEQGLMPKDIGKQFEWSIAKSSDNGLALNFQDYDWADEVLHAQIGRKWLIPEFENMKTLREKAKRIMERNLQEKRRLSQAHSDQKAWWPDFLNEIRAGRDRLRRKEHAQ